MLIGSKSKWVWGIIGAGTLITTILIFSCGKQGDESVKAQEIASKSRQSAKQVQENLAQPSVVSQRLSKALKDGKFVYLFFYESGNSDCETMGRRLDSLAQTTKKKVEIIKVERRDPKNSDIVTSLKVQAAPIPLTILYDPQSAIVAFFTKAVTVEELTKAFPSPKKSEALKYVYQGKGVILSFSNQGMPSRKEIQTCCSQAKNELAGKAEYISIDLSDPKEAGFVNELKIDPNTPQPVTFVINPQGQLTGKYEGKVQVTDLVQAATRVVKSGCCPTGSGQACPTPTPQKKK